jgi:hypothetical protein
MRNGKTTIRDLYLVFTPDPPACADEFGRVEAAGPTIQGGFL